MENNYKRLSKLSGGVAISLANSTSNPDCFDGGECPAISVTKKFMQVVGRRLTPEQQAEYTKATGFCVAQDECVVEIPVEVAEKGGFIL